MEKYNTIIKCTMINKNYRNEKFPNSYLLIKNINEIGSDLDIDLKGNFCFNTWFLLDEVEIVKEIKSLQELYEFCKEKNIGIDKSLIHEKGILVGGARDYFIFNNLIPYGWIDNDLDYDCAFATDEEVKEILDNLEIESEEFEK